MVYTYIVRVITKSIASLLDLATMGYEVHGVVVGHTTQSEWETKRRQQLYSSNYILSIGTPEVQLKQ